MASFFRHFPKIRGGDALWSDGSKASDILNAETFDASSGSSVNVLAGFGLLVFTSFAPIVSTPVNINAGAGTITYTGFAPTVQTGVNIFAGFGQITFNGFAPTVQIPVNVLPSVGALSYAGFSPTVQTPRNVLPGVGAINYTGNAPTVQTPRNVLPGVGALVFNGLAPTVQTPVNVNAGVGAISYAGFAPTVQTPRNVLPGVGEVVFNGFAPVFDSSVNVLAQYGIILFEGFEPFVETPVIIRPETGSIVFVGFSPVVTIGTETTSSLLVSLVSYWNLDDNTLDSHGTNHGSGFQTYTAGKIKKSISSTYVFCGSDSSLKMTNSLSISIWFKTTDNYANNYLCGILAPAYNNNYDIRLSSFRIGLTLGLPPYFIDHNTPYSDNKWRHVVGTWDGSIAKLYIDGALKNHIAISGILASPVTNFTINSAGGFGPINGEIDEVGLWNRALSTNEILKLYNQGAGLSYPFISNSKSNFLQFFK